MRQALNVIRSRLTRPILKKGSLCGIAVTAVAISVNYGVTQYRQSTILTDQHNLIRAIYGDEGVLDNSPNSNAFIYGQIKKSNSPFILGALKLHDNLLTSQDMQQAATNPNVFIGVEGRLSEAEKVKGLNNVEEESATINLDLLRIDKHPLFKERVFSFINCNNAHLKIFFNNSLLILGTTDYDRPRTADGKQYKAWYGKESNSIDFNLVIKDPVLIKEFIMHLAKYLPASVKKALGTNYSNLASTSLTAEGSVAKLDKIRQGKLKTIFTWGPGDHKEALLKMIDGAKYSITIAQQDIQDPDIQEAIHKAAEKDSIRINIVMSQYPFRKPTNNAAIPFLEDLSRQHPATTEVFLTGREDTSSSTHIHAKVLIVDNYMYLGSANFYPAVLSNKPNHLNVGVITNEPKYVGPVTKRLQEVMDDSTTYRVR